MRDTILERKQERVERGGGHEVEQSRKSKGIVVGASLYGDHHGSMSCTAGFASSPIVIDLQALMRNSLTRAKQERR